MDLSTKISGLPADDCEVSDELMPFDANTPSSSPSQSQPNNYLWSDEKLQILNEHKVYHDSMSYYLTNLVNNGPDIDMPVPKPPKSKLQSLFSPKLKPEQHLIGLELHEYLKTCLVNTKVDINVRPWTPTSLENIKATLQDGYHILKQHNARLFNHYLLYGQALNSAFDYFSIAKSRAEVPHDMTWAKWLKDNIGISNSYAKQLRNIATSFGSYKQFSYLGISFKEFTKRKEHIRLMFSEHPELTSFWRKDTPP